MYLCTTLDLQMSDLFKKKANEDLRTKRKEVLFTEQEFAQVVEEAEIRILDVNEYIRRRALGKKADVRFDQIIVLTLHQLVQEIRRLYKITEENKTPLPPEVLEALGGLIDESGNAIQRISK
jgi:transcriptional antiterminator Rof (Rho-off)